MSIVSKETLALDEVHLPRSQKFRERLFALLVNTWEIYPILIIATFFRVFAVDKGVLGDDQAALFRLSHDAITHGILPASSNRASVGILHGPVPIYFYMLVAFFTSNPVWAAVETGLFNVLGVFVTYVFVRRYYGRLAGTLAAVLYAVSTTIVFYGRFIWQPNLIPPMTVLLMFALFWGGVERRKGWLAPTAVLIGLLYETHEGTIYMLLPVATALVLATWKTIRWRDIALSALALLLIFFPYVTYLFSAQFADLYILKAATSAPATVNDNVFIAYGFFMSPFVESPTSGINALPTNPHSLLNASLPFITALRAFLQVVHDVVPWLAFAGGLIIFLALFRPSQSAELAAERVASRRSRLITWLITSYNDPKKRGYVLLLVWQGIVPTLLTRYTVPLGIQYLLFFLPGPCILIAIAASKTLEFAKRWQVRWSKAIPPAIYIAISLLLCAEIIGSVTLVVDAYNGASDSTVYYPNYANDVPSIKNALQATAQLAQKQHISRIYIAANWAVNEAMRYFTQVLPMHAQVAVINTVTCNVLPDSTAGPVLYLVAPYNAVTDILLQRYTNATLVETLSRIGGDPFKLYIVHAKSEAISARPGFTNIVQLLEPHASRISVSKPDPFGGDWMMLHWRVTESQQSTWRTAYVYRFVTVYKQGDSPMWADCTMTRVYQGDQLLPVFPLQPQIKTPASLIVGAIALTYKPLIVHTGPIQFLTFAQNPTRMQQLVTAKGEQTITLPGS